MPLVAGKQIKPGTITSTQADTTNGTISTVNSGDAAVEGSGTGLSRRDHQHAVATGGTTEQIDVGDSAAEGSSSNLAREDHAHALPAPAAPANVTKAAASAGAATTVARADHKHDVTTATASELTDSTNAEGSATSLARSDHTHAHGNRGGGTLHSEATGGTAGFMSALDKTKLDTLQNAAGVDAKESVRARAQGNIDLATGGLLTIDTTVTMAAGERVLVDQQSTASQDGIYLAAVGTWTRALDAPATAEARGWIVHVEEGTNDGDKLWQCTNNKGSDVVGTDGLTFAQIGAGSPRAAGDGMVLNVNDLDVVANADGSIVVNANDIQVGVITEPQHGNLALNDGLQHAAATGSFNGFLTSSDFTKLAGMTAGAEPNLAENAEELTTENITGTDTGLTDTLAATPDDVTKVAAFLNGVKQLYGAGNDFTVSGTTLTWLASTGTAVDMETTDVLEVVYLS